MHSINWLPWTVSGTQTCLAVLTRLQKQCLKDIAALLTDSCKERVGSRPPVGIRCVAAEGCQESGQVALEHG